MIAFSRHRNYKEGYPFYELHRSTTRKTLSEIPSSALLDIFKELNIDLGCKIPESGCLEKWTKEGVMLLNSILTVEKDKPLSHQKYNCEKFTDAVIKKINETKPDIVIFTGDLIYKDYDLKDEDITKLEKKHKKTRTPTSCAVSFVFESSFLPIVSNNPFL